MWSPPEIHINLQPGNIMQRLGTPSSYIIRHYLKVKLQWVRGIQRCFFISTSVLSNVDTTYFPHEPMNMRSGISNAIWRNFRMWPQFHFQSSSVNSLWLLEWLTAPTTNLFEISIINFCFLFIQKLFFVHADVSNASSNFEKPSNAETRFLAVSVGATF